jgi:hypothetical protein
MVKAPSVNGATTLSITTLSITTLSITTFSRATIELHIIDTNAGKQQS